MFQGFLFTSKCMCHYLLKSSFEHFLRNDKICQIINIVAAVSILELIYRSTILLFISYLSHEFSFCMFYLASQISYSLQRLTAFQTQNLYIGPQSESELSHMNTLDLNPLFPGAEAKPDPIKGGLRVTSFFTYNCLAVSLSEISCWWCYSMCRSESSIL